MGQVERSSRSVLPFNIIFQALIPISSPFIILTLGIGAAGSGCMDRGVVLSELSC